MHLPTYLVLMAIGGLYGVAGLIANWFINGWLFAVSIAVLFITAFGAYVQAVDEDDWEIKWMLWYLVPAGLLLVGNVAVMQDNENQILELAGETSLISIVPGKASDYASAAKQHFLSMLYPFVARLVAEIAQIVKDKVF